MIDLSSISLPKWPGCDVDGDPVTEEQANEILVRTASTWFLTNDHWFKEHVERVFYRAIDKEKEWGDFWWVDPPYDPSELEPFEIKSERYERKGLYSELMGMLDLDYLRNHRVCSSYIGGPHGWCDWDGRIYQRNKNVGKWPDAMSIYNEWATIAKAFPYLRLQCRILAHEAGYHEEKPEIAFVLNVSEGNVRARPPQTDDYNHISMKLGEEDFSSMFMGGLTGYNRERGVAISRWRQACSQVANSQRGGNEVL